MSIELSDVPMEKTSKDHIDVPMDTRTDVSMDVDMDDPLVGSPTETSTSTYGQKNTSRINRCTFEQLNEETSRFEFIDTNVVDKTLANSIRREIITNVPTLAFHKVVIYQNTTFLNDEMLARRIGLIPLASVSTMTCKSCGEREDDSDRSYGVFLDPDCPNCNAVYEMDVCHSQEKMTASAETGLISTIADVTAESLIRVDTERGRETRTPIGTLTGTSSATSSHNQVVFPKTLLACLGRGQSIKLKAMARRGIGEEHVRWSPVSVVGFSSEDASPSPDTRKTPTVIYRHQKEKIRHVTFEISPIVPGTALLIFQIALRRLQSRFLRFERNIALMDQTA